MLLDPFYWDYCGDNVTYMFSIHARKDLFSFPTDIKHLCDMNGRRISFKNIFCDWTYRCVNGEHSEISK